MLRDGAIAITGASSGLGAALALHYAAKGHRMFLAGRDRMRLKAVAEAAVQAGATGVDIHTVDVTVAEAVASWLRGADAMAPLGLVIANAGISGGTAAAPAGEDEAQARAIFAVNLTGVLNTVHPAVEIMRARGTGGQIAVMASRAGFFGLPGAPAYSASKAAALHYALALRGALARDGIAVSAICPGFVKTAMTDANDFPMPFLMPADKAAAIMARGLARNTAVIAFPWPMLALVKALSILPAGLRQALFTRLPAKG